jgi:hypothetical protein
MVFFWKKFSDGRVAFVTLGPDGVDGPMVTGLWLRLTGRKCPHRSRVIFARRAWPGLQQRWGLLARLSAAFFADPAQARTGTLSGHRSAPDR